MKLGWIKDKPDSRDFHISKLALATPPQAASLKSRVIEILDQGGLSSCVANAWAQALRICDQAPLASREFIYYNALAFDGAPILDQGTQLRSAAQGLIKFGRPPETIWPYIESYVTERPTWEAYRMGYDFKGPAGYYRITTSDEMKQALAAGKPVVGGASVGESIMNYMGGIYDPPSDEPSIGGHALCFIGYTPDYFEIAGSWGVSYGEDGFMRVSYAWAQTFSDLWAVHL